MEVAESDRVEGVQYKEVTTIETTPKYYTVSLKQTQYGDPNGTTTMTFGWEKNADTGKLEFKQDPTTPVGQTITYKYNAGGSSLERIENKTAYETITGAFVGQTTDSSSSTQYGGAIYNGNSGTIGNITADFIGNNVHSKDKYALGGAIYQTVRKVTATAKLGLINNNFINNYATSENGIAKGGAIFTRSDLTISADNGIALISGNYTESNGVRENNAIYVSNIADEDGVVEHYTTLTLNAVNNGKIQIDDTITGGSSEDMSSDMPLGASVPVFWERSSDVYTLALTGDGTGTVSLYNDIDKAKVTSRNVTVDFANGETRDYEFVSMTANSNSKLNVDVDMTNKIADTITTQDKSTGTLILNSINLIGSSSDPITVQIIKNTSSSSNLQLALGNNILSMGALDIDDTVYNDEIYTAIGAIELATKDTKNDSITIEQAGVYDTLDLIATKESENERNFTFRTTDNYMLSKDLGTVTEGTLNINGKGSTTPSNINAQNHTLFNLENETTLNIKNTTIENAKDFAIKAEHEKAVVNLNNASFKNTTGTAITQ